MRDLLKKGSTWYWDSVLDGLFIDMWEVIAREVEKGVTLFDPTLNTAVLTDWCKSGLGYLLMQKHCKCHSIDPRCCPGGWRVTMVGSRFTNRVEGSYSSTEGEMLAVQENLHRSRYYTLGCDKLLVGTDHRPLLGLLNNKKLEWIDNPRLLKLKTKTLGWRFSIMYIPGKETGGPDCLSRYGMGQGQVN